MQAFRVEYQLEDGSYHEEAFGDDQDKCNVRYHELVRRDDTVMVDFVTFEMDCDCIEPMSWMKYRRQPA